MAVLTEKAKLPEVEAAVEAQLARLRSTPPSQAELDKAKRQLRSSFVFGLQTNNGRSIQLGQFTDDRAVQWKSPGGCCTC